MIRTVWVAGLFLVAVGGLFATKVVFASASQSGNHQIDTTASVLGQTVPGDDTLSRRDRLVVAPPADTDDADALPIESDAVSVTEDKPAPAVTATTARPAPVEKHRPVAKTARRTTKPAKHTAEQAKAEQAKAAAGNCRQQDLIGRFLASTHLRPHCQG